MHKTNNAFKASTLAEVLVMMILAGILLLTLSEGAGLLKKYARRLAASVRESTEYYNHYYTLGEWFSRAIKIETGPDSSLLFKFPDRPAIVLFRQGGLLMAFTEERTDTLFRNVLSAGLRHGNPSGRQTLYVRLAGENSFKPENTAVQKYAAKPGNISGTVYISGSQNPFTILFTREAETSDTLIIRLEETEKKYAYEP